MDSLRSLVEQFSVCSAADIRGTPLDNTAFIKDKLLLRISAEAYVKVNRIQDILFVVVVVVVVL